MTAVSNPSDAPVDIMETISRSGFQSGSNCELVGVNEASGLSLAPATAFNATTVTTDFENAPSSSISPGEFNLTCSIPSVALGGNDETATLADAIQRISAKLDFRNPTLHPKD